MSDPCVESPPITSVKTISTEVYEPPAYDILTLTDDDDGELMIAPLPPPIVETSLQEKGCSSISGMCMLSFCYI